MSSFFTDTILERGKKYFEQNRVFSVNQKDDKTYTGIVLGSEAYHTKINVDDTNQVVDASCDCPYAEDGRHCKHEAALYFAIEKRLPKQEEKGFDVNGLLKKIRKKTRNNRFINYEFRNSYDDYLEYISESHKAGSKMLDEMQDTIDALLSATYPEEYFNTILYDTFECYEELMIDEESINQTYEWLKSKVKYKRYYSHIRLLLDIIKVLKPRQQMDIIKEILLKQNINDLLDTYIQIAKENGFDVKKALEEVSNLSLQESYIIEMVRYYLDQGKSEQAKKYYSVHKKRIKSDEGEAKIESILTPGREDAYFEYVIEETSYYRARHELYYRKLKQFYGKDFDEYFLEFIAQASRYLGDFDIFLLFKGNRDVKYLIYYLLYNPSLSLFNNAKEWIQSYSEDMYLFLYVECLKKYLEHSNGGNYIENHIYDLFGEIDEISRIEFVEMLKKEYPRRKKLLETLDRCLESYSETVEYRRGDDYFDDDEI